MLFEVVENSKMLFEAVESCAISPKAIRNRLTATEGKIEKNREVVFNGYTKIV